ncbi:SMI1/KNR4 family protein [Capnocytophaga sp. HP1101]
MITFPKYLKNWTHNPAIDTIQITSIEKLLNFSFPEDYRLFLQWSNGGEGYIDESYLSLWKAEDLSVLNAEYQIQKYLSDKYIAIGTDGGGICYGFCKAKDFAVFQCPLGDLDPVEAVIIANSFEDFIKGYMSLR